MSFPFITLSEHKHKHILLTACKSNLLYAIIHLFIIYGSALRFMMVYEIPGNRYLFYAADQLQLFTLFIPYKKPKGELIHL